MLKLSCSSSFEFISSLISFLITSEVLATSGDEFYFFVDAVLTPGKTYLSQLSKI